MFNLNQSLYINIYSALTARQLFVDGADLKAHIAAFSNRPSQGMVNIIANILLLTLGAQWQAVNIDQLAEELAGTVNRERLGL